MVPKRFGPPQALHPDLIVLDLSMPIMNGLEAAKKLTSLLPAVPLDHVHKSLRTSD